MQSSYPVTTVVLDSVPFQTDPASMMKKLRIREGSAYETDFLRIVEEAKSIARPKALYKTAFVDEKGDDTLSIDGVTLTSRVLRVNLDGTYRVFPYVVTCGVEIDEWSRSFYDLLHKYWLDAIKEMAVRSASRAMRSHIVENHRPGALSAMAPGSLGDWPITQQRPLFTILGDTEGSIGVRLSSTCLMIPEKSVSGILFPTETRFESCQLCPRDVCPGRRAPYDRGLFDRKYRLRN